MPDLREDVARLTDLVPRVAWAYFEYSVIEKSYSTKKRKVKGTKTENPREMPVHPTLARILAEWRLSGFE